MPRVRGTVHMHDFDQHQHHDLRLRKDLQSERRGGTPVHVHVHMDLLHQNLLLRKDQHHGLRVGHRCPHPEEEPDLMIVVVERETAGLREDLMSGVTAGRREDLMIGVERETAGRREDLMSGVTAGHGARSADWSH